MKILVTGAGGFLGRRVVRRLLELGASDLRCMIRDAGKGYALEALRAQFPQANLEITPGNLLYAEDSSAACRGIDVIFHLASAMTGSPADLFLNSVAASERMLHSAAEQAVRRIVLVSSFGVYGTAELGRGAVIDEQSPLEPHPERRDSYSHAKLWQEELFREFQARHNRELVIMRPGVIYGPGGGHFSARVGLNLFGLFLHLGGRNCLPLTYVDNCADAIVFAGLNPSAAGQVFNVHDDDLITSRQYLKLYQHQVQKIRSVYVPYHCLRMLASGIHWYHRYSRGQLPAIFTPYKVASLWGGNRFSNSKLKGLGWKQGIPTAEGLARTLAHFRSERTAAKP